MFLLKSIFLQNLEKFMVTVYHTTETDLDFRCSMKVNLFQNRFWKWVRTSYVLESIFAQQTDNSSVYIFVGIRFLSIWFMNPLAKQTHLYTHSFEFSGKTNKLNLFRIWFINKDLNEQTQQQNPNENII